MTQRIPIPKYPPRQTLQPVAPANPEQSCLVLLAEVESSLRSSQAALLSRDIARIEELTREQEDLRRALSVVFRSGECNSSAFSGDAAEALRAACARVLYLGRVQSALLRRAQQSLRTISHLMAGPQSAYGTVASCPSVVVPCRNPRSEEV